MSPQTAPTRRSTPQRTRLSDLTNTTRGAVAKERQITKPQQHQDENGAIKGCSDRCQTEITSLRKQLAEKDKIIEDQKAKLDKIWNNYCLKTKQNEDIIKKNAQLFKECMHARDKLKLLEHESVQMAAVHKIFKSALQLKHSNVTNEGNNIQKAVENPEKQDKQTSFPSVLLKLAESRARRTGEVLDGGLENKETPTTSKTTLRRRDSLSYREPSLKTKLRQPEDSSNQSKGCSRQGRGLHKLTEEQESEIAEDVLTPNEVEDEQHLNQDKVNMDIYDVLSHPLNQGSCNAIQKTTMARPCRRSVGSICSYKETPLNIKMRRAD